MGQLFVNFGHENSACDTQIDLFKSPLGAEFVFTLDGRTVMVVNETANEVMYLDNQNFRSVVKFT